MFRALTTSILLFAGSAWGECLTVSEADFNWPESPSHQSMIVWEAVVSNACDDEFDVELEANFLGAGGTSVYLLRALVNVGPGERLSFADESYVPSRHKEAMNSIEVRIAEARRRPY